MKHNIRNSIATLAFAAFALSAQAVPITGAVSIAGGVTPAGGNINTATSFTSLGPALATQTSGSFVLATSGINTIFDAGTDSVFTMTPFSYGTTAAPLLAPNPVQVWTTTNGAITTTFNLTSIYVVDHNIADQVTLLGLGFFTMTGFNDTSGTFNLTANQGGSTFSFSASNVATTQVPDSGSTALLLSLGLACVGFGVRSLKLKNA